MIEVLHDYKDVEIVNAGLVKGILKEPSTVTISYTRNPASKRSPRLRRTARTETASQSSGGLRVQATGNRIVIGKSGPA